MAELRPPGPPPMMAMRRVGKVWLGMVEDIDTKERLKGLLDSLKNG